MIPRLRARRRRGYTIVELLMALTVLAIGVSGIIAMQKVTVSANRHARSLALATNIAQAWIDQLNADAVLWNHPSPRPDSPPSDIGETRWLNQIATNDGVWFEPEAVGQFGPAFDALGNVVPAAADPSQVVFCTHLRLTWLQPETGGSGLIRAEVRVFWLRDGGGGAVADGGLCNDGAVDQIGAAVTNYHFVYQTTAIKQNTAS